MKFKWMKVWVRVSSRSQVVILTLTWSLKRLFHLTRLTKVLYTRWSEVKSTDLGTELWMWTDGVTTLPLRGFKPQESQMRPHLSKLSHRTVLLSHCKWARVKRMEVHRCWPILCTETTAHCSLLSQTSIVGSSKGSIKLLGWRLVLSTTSRSRRPTQSVNLISQLRQAGTRLPSHRSPQLSQEAPSLRGPNCS